MGRRKFSVRACPRMGQPGLVPWGRRHLSGWRLEEGSEWGRGDEGVCKAYVCGLNSKHT